MIAVQLAPAAPAWSEHGRLSSMVTGCGHERQLSQEKLASRAGVSAASGNVCLVGGVTPSRALGASHSASHQPSAASTWSASIPSRNSLTARLDLST
jgi:hypothetical protein